MMMETDAEMVDHRDDVWWMALINEPKKADNSFIGADSVYVV